MTISHNHYGEDNIARLNAFLDQCPDGGLDPEFDDATEELERQFVEFRHNLNHD